MLIALAGLVRCQRDEARSDFCTTLGLPDSDRQLIQFLLLLPAAALVVCFFRNVVGVPTFGTFAPALLGLAFRESPSLIGGAVLLVILTFGWILRHGLDQLHLLQVPRTAFLLSLVVCLILAILVVASTFGVSIAASLPMLPLVILTGMIERFWCMEEEEGTGASFRTLFHTIGIAGLILMLARMEELRRELLVHPESLGFVMAGQLMIGRYLGYRLTELYRFRNLLR